MFQGHDRMGSAAATQLIRQGTYALVVFGLIRTVADVTAEAIGADQVWAGSDGVRPLSGRGVSVAGASARIVRT